MEKTNKKYVIKRSGRKELISNDKIFYRIKKLIDNPLLGKLDNVSALVLSSEVDDYCINGITTTELDNIAAKFADAKKLTHDLNYEKLAVRLTVSNLHKNTTECFSNVMESLYDNIDSKGRLNSIINERFISVVRKNKDILNSKIDYNRDYTFTDYFGIKTLESKYLLRKFTGELIKSDSGKGREKTVLAERPQHLLMRVAIGLYYEDINSVLKTYDLMSQGYFTHASPTLFNAGTKKEQLASCFLLHLGDSLVSIGKTQTDSMIISGCSGGIGCAITRLRAEGSHINGNNGTAGNVIKPLRIFDAIMEYADQGGKRPGSMAVYCEPWHANILSFLDARKPIGEEKARARGLFYSMWINDAFMEAVAKDEDWWLMCPNECHGLVDCHGEEFTKLYYSYIEKGMYREKVKASYIMTQICIAQIETGGPYIGFKDHVNNKTNQMNLGTQDCSNLCIEINIKNDKDNYGTCNIATMNLPKYIETNNKGHKIYNFKKLYDVTKHTVHNLNKVIDNSFYPVPETKNSNLKNRPIAVGAQGLANVFLELAIPFDSIEAKKINLEIYETIQFACLESSNEIAKAIEDETGKPGYYSTFKGSPASEGLFQHNLWGVKNDDPVYISGRWDWDALKEKVIKHGLRNSLVTASPPTATTSQILGNYESFEPIPNNFTERSTVAGNFTIVNRYLINDLIKLNIWNDSMKNKIIENRGSIQKIDTIPNNIKSLYKTVWEIKQMVLVDMSADRGLFTDQSQSFNIHISDPSIGKLSSIHMYSWKKGLKSGMYYLRQQTKTDVQKFNSSSVKETIKEIIEQVEAPFCSINNRDCEACSG